MTQIEFKKFIIEKLSEDNVKDVQYLFLVAFQTNVSEEFIRNKHINCGGPHNYIGYLAYDSVSREPAAYYAVYPGYMLYDNKQILVAQSGDTMTNPKFQKQGLFVELAKITFEYCEKIGIEMITGLPNSNSYHGFIKHLGFEEFPKFVNLCFLQNKFEFHRFTKRSKIALKLHQSYAKFIFYIFFRKCNHFENSNQQESNLAFMEHDKDYYMLKNSRNNLFIRIKKVNIWLRIEGNNIAISDIDLDNKQAFKLASILAILRLLTFITGFRFLNFNAAPNGYLYSKIKDFSTSKTDGYTFIIKNLGSKIPLQKVSLLSCDADVF